MGILARSTAGLVGHGIESTSRLANTSMRELRSKPARAGRRVPKVAGPAGQEVEAIEAAAVFRSRCPF